MPEQQKLDAKYVKEKILKFLEEKGPSLPIQVAKSISLNTLFTSAFLSEMASEGLIKISHMKVGGSPLYYTPSKVAMLENFTNYLETKEQEACKLLKEKGILEDRTQQPAIRVALRNLKDFALPFKKDEKIYWRYFTLSEEKVRELLEKDEQDIEEKKQAEESKAKLEESIKVEKEEEKEEEKKEIKLVEAKELQKIKEELEKKSDELEKLKQELKKELETKKEVKLKETKDKKIVKKLKKKQKANDRFLNEFKEILAKKQIELLNIEQFDKKQVFARVKVADKEILLVAYNKKKLEDSDLIKAYKKAEALNLPYSILSKGEPSKKTKEAIEAYKKLATIEKIEEDKKEDRQKDNSPKQ